MTPTSPTDRQAPRAAGAHDDWSRLGDVASAFVRRMNEAELTPAAVADVVAEDLSELLGGAVAVILRDQRTGAEASAVSGQEQHGATNLERTVEQHTDEHRALPEDLSTGGPKDFVDVVLETGQTFVAPDGPGAREAEGEGPMPGGDQPLLAVPVAEASSRCCTWGSSTDCPAAAAMMAAAISARPASLAR